MAHTTAAKVQQWLEETKLPVPDLDTELEGFASLYVLGRIGSEYDTSGWTDSSSTPQLLQDLIAMYVAAWMWRRAYGEVIPDGQNSYADRLEMWAESVISMILGGTIAIPGVTPTTTSAPGYMPDEFTGSQQQYDAAGKPVGGSLFDTSEFSEDIKFRMGARF